MGILGVPYPKENTLVVQWCSLLNRENLVHSVSLRAGSSAIDFTQLGHRKCFGTK